MAQGWDVRGGVAVLLGRLAAQWLWDENVTALLVELLVGSLQTPCMQE